MEKQVIKLNFKGSSYRTLGFLSILFLILSGVSFFLFIYFINNFSEIMDVFPLTGDVEADKMIGPFYLNIFLHVQFTLIIIGVILLISSIICLCLRPISKSALYSKTIFERIYDFQSEDEEPSNY